MPERPQESESSPFPRSAGGVDMRFPIRPVLIFFALLIPVYILCFRWIEHTRDKDGPWVLGFQTDGQGVPSLIIQQSALGLDGVEVRFPEERWPQSNLRTNITLVKPLIPLPFGTRLSEDLTFRPGVETLDLFGHEIDIAPRVLVINHQEITWSNRAVHILRSSEKLPPEARKPKGKKR